MQLGGLGSALPRTIARWYARICCMLQAAAAAHAHAHAAAAAASAYDASKSAYYQQAAAYPTAAPPQPQATYDTSAAKPTYSTTATYAQVCFYLLLESCLGKLVKITIEHITLDLPSSPLNQLIAQHWKQASIPINARSIYLVLPHPDLPVLMLLCPLDLTLFFAISLFYFNIKHKHFGE